MSGATLPFILAAVGLLGSPGPGIAALVAVGRSCAVPAAIRFYLSMQLGLAIAAAISILGLVILLEESPGLRTGLMVVATAYLLWLAWAIGTSPGGVDSGSQDGAFSSRGAFILGVANPKAYLAFAALFGSFTLLPQSSAFAEGIIKWTLSVAVMLVVDFGWLGLGMLFGRIPLPPRGERVLNLMMGAAIVLATLLAWA